MAVTVAVVNMKGGTGKTTVAVNLAWQVSRQKRVLVVDLDPQFNASQYLMGSTRYKKHIDQNGGTVVDVFEQHVPPAISKRQPATGKLEAQDVVFKVSQGLDLIPSRLELSWTLKKPGVEGAPAGRIPQHEVRWIRSGPDRLPTDRVDPYDGGVPLQQLRISPCKTRVPVHDRAPFARPVADGVRRPLRRYGHQSGRYCFQLCGPLPGRV